MRYKSQGFLNVFNFVKLGIVCQCVEPFPAKQSFDLAETSLNTIELGWVTYIFYLLNVQLSIKMFDIILVRMNFQLVHQYRKRSFSILLTKIF